MNVIKEHFAGKKCFVAGHTGFKGSWLPLWLHQLGERVHGCSWDPPTKRSAFVEATACTALVSDTRADIANLTALTQSMRPSLAKVVFGQREPYQAS